MSKEKSQLENMTMPPAKGGVAKKNTTPKLPANFSMGQGLEKEQPVSKAESVKSFMPSFSAQTDRLAQEEIEIKARTEKEGANYDLCLLIKNKLADEFTENLKKALTAGTEFEVRQIIRQTSLMEYIQKNPELYTPNPKDLAFIAQNLRELFPKISENEYPLLGNFLNLFIHAYFDSVPQEERKNLKLFLPNTAKLNNIGAELVFGELEVEEVGNFFGNHASGNASLKAQRVGNSAGEKMHGYAQMEVGEARDWFGFAAYENAALKAKKTRVSAGQNMEGNAQMEIEEAGIQVGTSIKDHAQIKITKIFTTIGEDRSDDSQIILPDGLVLRAGESA